MQSKKSYFNMTLFKKNLMRFWPIWGVYTAYLLVLGPVMMYLGFSNAATESLTQTDLENAKLATMAKALEAGSVPIVIAVVSVISAMAVFSYLYSSRSANMMHAFPMNRTELFITNYVSGLLSMLVPQILSFIISVFVCFAFEATEIQYLLYWLMVTVGSSLALYSIAVFTGMLTGQLLVAPVFFAVANFLYVGVKYITNQLIMAVCYGMNNSLALADCELFSPLYTLYTNVNFQCDYSQKTYLAELVVSGGNYVAVYAAVAVLFTLAAWVIYLRRPLETAGDIVCKAWVKPILRWGTAVCSAELSASLLYTLFATYGNNLKFISLLFCAVIAGTLMFFVAEMFIEKSFRVLHKNRIIECGVLIVVMILGMFAIKKDVLGLEKIIPDSSDVEIAYVNMYNPVGETSEEGIQQIENLQQKLIDLKPQIAGMKYEDGMVANSVTFKYFMKDGSRMERTYTIYTEEDVSSYDVAPVDEVESVLYQIYRISFSYENYMEYNFCQNYEEIKAVSGSLELYDRNNDMEYSTIEFTAEQSKALLEAIKQDIKEGKMFKNMRQLYSSDTDYWFENSVSIDFSVDGGIISQTDQYYENENGYENNQITQTNTYISLNRDCEHTLQALLDLGLIDSIDQLIPCDEFRDSMDTE